MGGGMLLVAGLVVAMWRPCRALEGRAPRAAVALLLLSATAIWLGAFAVAVRLAVPSGDTWTACGMLWQQIVAGQLEWWRMLPLAVWIVAFPGRASAAPIRHHVHARHFQRGLQTAAIQNASHDVMAVDGLSTPAVTVGILTPRVLVDAAFWESATPLERDVVVAHERTHAKGRHALIEAAATFLIAPFRPLNAAADLYECVRRHLEALADDGAVRAHGREAVGRAVGRIALQAYPATGLGATGACVWRVKRLLAPTRRSRTRDCAVMAAMVAMMALMLLAAGAETARALGPVTGADYCLVAA